MLLELLHRVAAVQMSYDLTRACQQVLLELLHRVAAVQMSYDLTRACWQVLLELLHRVAAHAGANGMDAGALGEVFAPCIAWQPPPPKKVRYTPHSGRRPCSQCIMGDLEKFVVTWKGPCVACLLQSCYIHQMSGTKCQEAGQEHARPLTENFRCIRRSCLLLEVPHNLTLPSSFCAATSACGLTLCRNPTGLHHGRGLPAVAPRHC